MANAKFKKEQEVYAFFKNDNDGSVIVRKFIVDSCGAKRMHLRRLDDGSMAEFRAYAPYNEFEACADVADPQAHALQLSAQCIARMVKYWNDKLTGADGSTAWCDSESGRKIARDNIAKYEAAVPTVK